MANEYIAAIDSALTPMELVITGTGAGTYAVPSGYYAHVEFGSLAGMGLSATCTALSDAFSGLGAAGFTLSFDTSLGYTLSRASGNFAIDWAASTACTNAKLALGFTSNLSGAITYSSTARPYYQITPAIDARSADSDLYEPDDLSEEAVSDGGIAYIVSKETEELRRDWTQQMESKSAVLSRAATAQVPWTWQHFFRHLRGELPFTILDSEEAIYQLRAEGTAFDSTTRARVTPDYDDLWNISIRARHVGYVS